MFKLIPIEDMRNLGALQKLARLLSKGKALTAAQVAAKMECSKPIAYFRLKSLEGHGLTLSKEMVKQACTGPPSAAYRIVENAKLKTFLRK